MSKQDEPLEIFIRTMPETVKDENKRPKKQQGQHDISMASEKALANIKYSNIPSELKSLKPELLKKLMSFTKNQIKTVVQEMSEISDLKDVKKLDLEFGVGFTGKFGVSIFELSGNQSLKITVTIEK